MRGPDLEHLHQEVNSAWKGLGYYRRARSLLSGAKKVMSDPKYQGRTEETLAFEFVSEEQLFRKTSR